MMKKFKSILLLLMLFGPMTATLAHADRHGFYGGRFGVGVVIDPWPLAFPYAGYPYGYYPYGYAPYGYYPPVVVSQQATPTTYMEQGAPQGTPAQTYAPASHQASDWYYCHKPEGYYPYVRACPDGWQRVPSQPPTQQ
jgi:hypothetical protein